jgi:hypothetical protein
MTLRRRTPLRRHQPLTSRATLARSGRLRAESPKRRNERDARRAVRDEVFARDGWSCQVAARVPDPGSCAGPLTPHHRRKAGQGGAYSVENISAVCAHHNERLEADADLAARARAAGLVVRPGDPEWDRLGR